MEAGPGDGVSEAGVLKANAIARYREAATHMLTESDTKTAYRNTAKALGATDEELAA